MPNYRRNPVAGGYYFFTFNLHEKNRSMLTDHIGQLRDSVSRVKRFIDSIRLVAFFGQALLK